MESHIESGGAMIFDYFSSDSPQIRADLEKIDALLCSDLFLRGLGVNAKSASELHGFSVVNDLEKAHEMMTSQDIWSSSDPRPFQYFPAIAEDELGRLSYENGLSNDDRVNRNKKYQENISGFDEACFGLIERKLHSEDSKEFLSNFYPADKINWILYNQFPNDITDYIKSIIKGIYLTEGLHGSVIFTQFYQAFMTGGIPCGWIGPLPEDGGNPFECLQLLHFGDVSIV